MKRRELLKKSILGLSATAVALSGCNKKSEKVACKNNEDELKIIPKQTAQYEFSCPLPFNIDAIDEIVRLNQRYQKSQITSLYNNLPTPFANSFNQCAQVDRGGNELIKSYDDFFKYVDYATNKGFKFVYLMNSPKPISIRDYELFKNDFNKTLDLLKKHNIKDIKIANPQVAILIQEHSPNEFNFSVSTASEYHMVSQYSALFENYPNYDLIDITNSENQNFKLLSNLRKQFPNIKLEIMVNEICTKDCPARISHIGEFGFCRFNCTISKGDRGMIGAIVKSGCVYPWWLKYYSALGINNFKFTAEGAGNIRGKFDNIEHLAAYLDCIEYETYDISAYRFFNSVFKSFYMSGLNVNKDIKLSDIKDCFPDIRQFIKNGDKCATKCGVDCNYCPKCAKKLEQKLLYG